MARPRRVLSDTARQLLDEAWEAHLAAEQARRRRDELAVSAAESGATWREVGAAIGMSAQAAHERLRDRLAGG
ncbi:MAG: hypothetical protein WAL63_20445 [Solirubrobacteraceae bacterium]